MFLCVCLFLSCLFCSATAININWVDDKFARLTRLSLAANQQRDDCYRIHLDEPQPKGCRPNSNEIANFLLPILASSVGGRLSEHLSQRESLNEHLYEHLSQQASLSEHFTQRATTSKTRISLANFGSKSAGRIKFSFLFSKSSRQFHLI